MPFILLRTHNIGAVIYHNVNIRIVHQTQGRILELLWGLKSLDLADNFITILRNALGIEIVLYP